MHPIELLGDVGHVKSHFGLFGYSVSVGGRLVQGFAPNVQLDQKSFWTHPTVLLGHKAQVDAFFTMYLDAR
jgi:hypothetical protein